jgi:hypothetical protein
VVRSRHLICIFRGLWLVVSAGSSRVRRWVATLGYGAPVGRGGVLDDEAMAKYKSQYTQLQAELEEAQRFNDRGRIDPLTPELEAFGLELAIPSPDFPFWC